MHPDVAVVGAGAFGAWTAWHLHKAGVRVALYDQYGPGNSRASSGGESRIIRAGYGPREIYTAWTKRSLPQWRALADRTDPTLFTECGALFIAPGESEFASATERVFARQDVRYEKLAGITLLQRFPQFAFRESEVALYEPDAGALLARRAVQTLVRLLVSEGVSYEQRQIHAGDRRAGTIVFACGPWLPKVFPALLGRRIVPTRQEVLFFGPSREAQLTATDIPCWMDVASGYYGFGDLESRGFKIADDNRGLEIDPDTESRTVADEVVARAREYMAFRVPALAGAPLIETRVCQYENTFGGDYLIDRHPDLANTWIAGGGSGHGFKHGPAVGEYLCDLILGRGVPEPQFALAAKREFSGEVRLSSL